MTQPKKTIPIFEDREARLVCPHIYQIPLPVPYPFGYVNCYLLKGPDSVALVDTGIDYPDTTAALKSALQEFGMAYADIDMVLMTHHHPDHYGNAGLFEEAGATVFMLDLEIQSGHHFFAHLDEGLEQFEREFTRHGVPEEIQNVNFEDIRTNRSHMHLPSRLQPLQHGQTIDIAGMRLHVIWTPGHADGHASFLTEDGILLSGDFLLERITPIIGKWPYSRPEPLRDFLNALENVKDHSPKMALTGHYGPSIPALERSQQLITHHHRRLDATLGALGETPKTAWDISLDLFSAQLDAKQRRFAWAETLAHLEYLEQEGQLVSESTSESGVTFSTT
ncbi:MAG: MBL fold metallo-hydrolase [Deinococcaceae bacterium]